MRIIRGFTLPEEQAIRCALELADTPIGLIVESATLDAGVLGMSCLSATGRPVILLDLDQFILPTDAIVMLTAHELAHFAGDHVTFYELLGKSKSLDVDEKRALQDLCEANADDQVADWGFAWAIAAWKRCFPDDRLHDPQWNDQARARAEPVRRRLEHTYGA